MIIVGILYLCSSFLVLLLARLCVLLSLLQRPQDLLFFNGLLLGFHTSSFLLLLHALLRDVWYFQWHFVLYCFQTHRDSRLLIFCICYSYLQLGHAHYLHAQQKGMQVWGLSKCLIRQGILSVTVLQQHGMYVLRVIYCVLKWMQRKTMLYLEGEFLWVFQ